ncbi:MAG: site-2 protease family protein [Butyricicoccaceae bacterium]
MRVVVQPSFVLLWAVLCLLDTQGLLLVFVPAAALHELGHLGCLYALGGRAEQLELNGAGANIWMTVRGGFFEEALIASAGPVTNLIGALVCAALQWEMAAGAHLILGMFNLLPILPLDGGRLLVIVLELTPLGWRAQEWALRWSCGCSLLVLCAGLYFILVTNNPTLLFVGGYLTGNACKMNAGKLY